MMFGVVLVGTYTSIFIAAPILIYLGVGAPATRAANTGVQEVTMAGGRRTPASAAPGAHRRLWQWRFPLRRHVAPRLAAVLAGRHLGLAGRAAEISAAVLELVFARGEQLDVFLIGAGRDPWPIPERLRARFRALGVSVDAMATGPAVRTYNILLAENRRVGAGLIAVD